MRSFYVTIFLTFCSACHGTNGQNVQIGSANQDFYQAQVSSNSFKLNQKSTFYIEIQPGSNFKINTEFPVALTPSVREGIQFSHPTLSKEQIEVSDEKLRIPVEFTAQASGPLKLEAVADFSVCNENTCKLLKGEKLSWSIQVESN